MPDPIDFHPLFSQLQSRYPTSSLITELVHAQDGRFTVRAMAQISGTPLATSMASAPTVEAAEDQARLRLLHLLGLSQGLSQELSQGLSQRLNTELPTASTAMLGSAAVLGSAAMPPPAYPETQAQLLADPVDMSSWLEARSASSPAPSSPIAISPPLPEFSDSPLFFEFEEADTPPPLKPVYAFGSSATRPSGEPATDPDLTAPPAAGSESASPATKSRVSKAKAATPAATLPKSEPSPVELPPAELLPADAPKAIAEPMSLPVIDLTPIFLQIEDEMERIGWTKAQGRSHLKTAYGKRSRQELTDEELTDFLNHLKGCPVLAYPELE